MKQIGTQSHATPQGEETAAESWEPPGQPADPLAMPLPAQAPRQADQPKSQHLRLVRRKAQQSASPTALFRKRHYPHVGNALWNDWRWQVRNRVTTLEALSRFITPGPLELAAFARPGARLPLGITPYYLSLLDPDNPADPMRRTVLPHPGEFIMSPGEAADPLGEDADTPVPGLVHRYPDRVLFLATGFCSTYCRYCTRSRMVGSQHGGVKHNRRQMEDALAYIAAHPEIRDVVVSGGDPLTLSDQRLEWILTRLRAIEHVEIIRLGTKTPAVLPQRITPALVRMLKRFHPLYMSLHFAHPGELTPETGRALARLADAGIPLGSQTVLLAGVNDDVDTMRRLCQGLLKNRVKPYYLYQCDPIAGSAHFRTPVSKGLEIIGGLRGHTSGYAVPTFVIDAPGGGGKVALYPQSVAGVAGGDLLLTNYAGGTYRYPDPGLAGL